MTDDMKTARVPCNGCTSCCQGDMIILHPECGDNSAEYQTVECVNPVAGKAALMLAHKPNGDCIYLERGVGCTIHGKAPTVCREFDCRRMYLKMMELSRVERRLSLKHGFLSKPIITAGKKRFASLNAPAPPVSP